MKEIKSLRERLNETKSFSPKTLPNSNSSFLIRSVCSGSGRNNTHQLPILCRTRSPQVLTTKKSHKNKDKKVVFNNYGKVKAVAINSSPGTNLKNNLDRTQIILNIKRPVLFENPSWPKSSFFGLYSGYHGRFTADFLKEYLHEHIFACPDFPVRLKASFSQGFQNCEASLVQSTNEISDFSGSSAVTFAIIGNQCIIGNIGNSKAILSQDHGQKVHVLTTEDILTSEIEKKRILDSGAKVFTEYRIDKNGGKIETGKCRINPGGLHVTRCFGSPQGKRKTFGGYPGGLIVSPHLKTFKIKENFDFVLLASPGFFEEFSCEEIVGKIWEDFKMNGGSEEKVDLCLEGIVRTGVKLGCKGSLTLILIGFESLINFFNDW